MITLITGGPGTGKTAWLLDQLLEIRKQDKEREFFIHGVRNLRGLPHKQIFCKSQLCDICQSQTPPHDALYVENWPEWKQSGSLIVVDEVQRIWRPRVGGSPLPLGVSGLETHRHYGLDFWLISQGPHLFDIAIRLLVGRHVHLVSRWSGRTQYEWPECKQDVQARTDAVTRPYSLPTHVYKMYDSAEIHTKQEKRKPIAFYAMFASFFIAVVFGFICFDRLQNKLKPTTTINSVKKGDGSAQAEPLPSLSNNKSENQAFPDFTPTIENVPESAPAYFPLIKVVDAPIMMGCVQSKTTGDCKCYTAQATVYPTTKIYCEETIANHRFNPYLARSVPIKEAKLKEETKSETLIN
jgi:zona occludens toxin